MVYTAKCSLLTGGDKPEEKSPNTQASDSDKKSVDNQNIPDPAKWGYDLYPERRGDKYKPSITGILFRGEGREQHDKLRCEENVYNCVKNSKYL